MKGNNTTQVKHDRFVHIAEKRMDTIIHDFYMLGKCADKNVYDYTKADLEKIFNELESQISTLKEKFAGQHRFTLAPSAADYFLSDEDAANGVTPPAFNRDDAAADDGNVVKDGISPNAAMFK